MTDEASSTASFITNTSIQLLDDNRPPGAATSSNQSANLPPPVPPPDPGGPLPFRKTTAMDTHPNHLKTFFGNLVQSSNFYHIIPITVANPSGACPRLANIGPITLTEKYLGELFPMRQ